MAMGTKGDQYTKEILQRILDEGCMDENPRPKYSDGTPAHTISVNHGMCTYDLTKGESPLITLRPIAVKKSIGELLWIYKDESNNLERLKEYGVTWWDEWDIEDRTIGAVYGETVRRHRLVEDLIKGLRENPDGRRHIISLWQVEDFKDKHGLKPCAFLTMWNVRHGKNDKGEKTDYLDMCLVQRSSDFLTAGCINQVQYVIFQHMIARHLGMTPGRFTWFYDNIQIYDRHIEQAKEIIAREPVDCNPKIVINPKKTNFYFMTPDDIEIVDYPREKIKTKNPQMKFDIGI